MISVTHSWCFFVHILFKKDTKIKKTMKYSKKMNSLKKGEGVPLLNFEGCPGVPLLKFEGGPGSWSQGSEIPGPGVLVPLLHQAQIRSFLLIRSYLLKKSLMENFIFLCRGWYSGNIQWFNNVLETTDRALQWLPFTYFMPLLSFYTFWKHQRCSGFLKFSGGIERVQWHEMS